MSKEKPQDLKDKSQQSCHSNSQCRKDTKQTRTRRYDIVDLLIVSVYNTIVFSMGLGLGWLFWHKLAI